MLSCAKKARIEWLHKGVLAGREGVQYVLLPFGVRVQRANVIATAVEKQQSDDGSFCSVVLDDGSDTISANFFGETLPICDAVSVGDVLLAMGDVREADGARCLVPDIVRKVGNPNFELLRELELRAIEHEHWELKKTLDGIRKASEEGKAEQNAIAAGVPPEFISALLEYEGSCHQQAAVVEEKIVDLRSSVLDRINELDSGNGVPYDAVISAMVGHGPDEVERALGELLNSGELYEPVAGVYRRL